MSREIVQIIEKIESYIAEFEAPVIRKVSKVTDRDPYRILIGTILSLRTKDETTEKAAERLFRLARTPSEMLTVSQADIEKAIYPVGFYKKKAKLVREISMELLEKHEGKVPSSIDELLRIKGVGRKTANLVMGEAFSKPGICVDTHVHRISNRLGVVKTKKPLETEMELMRILPREYWIRYNAALVPFGKNVCKPVSPLCSTCPVRDKCKRVGVERSR